MNPVGKRPFEGTIDTEAPASKKQKLEPPSSQVVPVTLNGDIMSRIVGLLSSKDILKFSAVAKSVESWTEAIFQEMRKNERLDFSWSCSEKEPYPQRASYVLGKALTVYVDRREKLIKIIPPDSTASRPSREKVETLHKSFRG